MQKIPFLILLSVIGVLFGGCQSSVNVEPLSFGHEDEIVRNDDFIILADRRVFVVMAFMNACGFDEETSGESMHPVRIRVREAIKAKAKEHPKAFRKWKRYYDKKALPSFCYQDYALSLNADYPFMRIRPDIELGYRFTVKLSDFPDILNEFWETFDIDQIWEQVKPDYLAEIHKYDLDRMAVELSFVWEYLRLRRKDNYTFVSVPNLLDSRNHAIAAGYENYCYAVESPGSNSHGFNIHEYLHSIVNELVEKNYRSHQKKLNAYFRAGKNMPMAKTYGAPVGYASESLIRAIDRRIMVLMADDPKKTKLHESIIKNVTRGGLLLAEPFYNLLIEYEQSEMNFEEYLPEMLEKLVDYSQQKL